MDSQQYTVREFQEQLEAIDRVCSPDKNMCDTTNRIIQIRVELERHMRSIEVVLELPAADVYKDDIQKRLKNVRAALTLVQVAEDLLKKDVAFLSK